MPTTTPATKMVPVTCPRCAGFPNAFRPFGHINSGNCLRCNGATTVLVPEGTVLRWESRAAEAMATHAAEIAAHDAGKPLRLVGDDRDLRIRRNADGTFTITRVYDRRPQQMGGISHATIGVRNGIVFVRYADEDILAPWYPDLDECPTATARMAFRAALQAAFDAAAAARG